MKCELDNCENEADYNFHGVQICVGCYKKETLWKFRRKTKYIRRKFK